MDSYDVTEYSFEEIKNLKDQSEKVQNCFIFSGYGPQEPLIDDMDLILSDEEDLEKIIVLNDEEYGDTEKIIANDKNYF